MKGEWNLLEYSRLLDIKRWKKINYMSATKIQIWINLEKYGLFWQVRKLTLKVQKADGTVVTYDGTNGDEMVGFYVIEKAAIDKVFDDRGLSSTYWKCSNRSYKDKGDTNPNS